MKKSLKKSPVSRKLSPLGNKRKRKSFTEKPDMKGSPKKRKIQNKKQQQ